MNPIRVFFFILLYSVFTFATDVYFERARELKLSSDPQWLNLLHYRLTALGQFQSQVKGKNFFLNPKGMYDAEAELEATLKDLLKKDPLTEDHALCRFPARKIWLQKRLNIPDMEFPKPYCKLYEFYRERMAAESIGVVFSSYYADSPSSAFGHTLFKINKKSKAQKGYNDLLDWGIGYAGVIDTSNSLVYVYKGLTGGFRGEFSSVPFYMKVREYNDYEARDMWIYDLNLTPEEVRFLLDHIWEVGDSYYDYYFLTQNCGFHMLTVLEAAAPRLKLTDKVPFWVMPGDALKAITSTPGLIKDITWRPSLFAQLKNRFESFSPENKIQFQKIQSPDDIEKSLQSRDATQQAAIIDAYILKYDYENAKKIALEDPVVLERRNKILSYRSKLPDIETLSQPIPVTERPDLSHPSARLTLIRKGDSDNFEGDVTKINMRFALHDALDPRGGYPDYSAIEMFTFEAAHSQKLNSTYFSEFQFLNIDSISPVDSLNFKKSWKSTVKWSRQFEPNCFNCSTAELLYGAGLAKEFNSENFLFYSLINGRLQGSPEQRRGFNFVIEPQFGVLAYLKDFSFRYYFSPTMSVVNDSDFWIHHNFESRYHFQQKYSFGIKLQEIDGVHKATGALGVFF